jgi:hypothetical protein
MTAKFADDTGGERTAVDRRRLPSTPSARWRTFGRRDRGLQNRLRGRAEASWVGSIPIHPRQSSLLMTAN